MRPIELKIKGINSYREEQVINFNQLTSQGFFGIFGPTGSGKSTILDAITLALYAKLPRGSKNFIYINETSASVSFRFSITTTETKEYLVERSFRILEKIVLLQREIQQQDCLYYLMLIQKYLQINPPM